MKRPIWSGTISFGLINIPVRLYSATLDHSLSFDMLHKKDNSPIRYAKICKAEEKEIPYEEVVKGYKIDKNEYIIITDEDFQKADPKKSKTIEIISFTDEDAIDSIFFEKPYFLEPDKGAAKAYLLLNEALKRSKKVGVVSFMIHSREHIGILKPQGRGIILNQLRYQSELKNFAEIELPVAKLQSKEIDVAIQLIDQLTDKFDPKQFKDTYKERLRAIINAKMKGKKPRKKQAAVPEAKGGVQDIMKKLKASLAQYHKPKKRAAHGTKRI